MSQRTKKVSFPCTVCAKQCKTKCIECSTCEQWVHTDCVPMSSTLLKKWTEDDINFHCPTCIYPGNKFDFYKCLTMLLTDKTAAKSVRLLIEMYRVQLDEVKTQSLPGIMDSNASEILKMFHPAVLNEYSPRAVGGDGNCLYRAVSLALYGSEQYHTKLRLFTTLEIIDHPEVYDCCHPQFSDLIKDIRVVTPPYCDILSAAATDQSYSDMIHMYAISAVINEPIQSYFPPLVINDFLTQPYSRKVIGRDVSVSGMPATTLMWSQTTILTCAADYKPNHFVPLCRHDVCAASVINLDESCVSAANTLERSLPSPLSAQASPTVTQYAPEYTPDIADSKMQSSITTSCNPGDTLQDIDESDIDDYQPFYQIPNDQKGTLDNHVFMSTDTVLDILTSASTSLQKIPHGVKQNIYFVIDNTANINRRNNKQKSDFTDDCGAWISASGATPKTHYLCDNDKLKRVDFRQGRYGFFKTENKKRTFIPFDPQPDPKYIAILHRNYTTLKLDQDYKRRISWFGQTPQNMTIKPVAIVEYIGEFPGRAPHGKSTKQTANYIRTPADTLKRMGDLSKASTQPKLVFNKLLLESDNILDEPRNLRQIHNKKYADKKKNNHVSSQNFADQLQYVTSHINEHPFVQQVMYLKDVTPCIVLYTPEQIQDIKTLCCSGRTCLSFDKTFNLGRIFATVAVYKHLSVIKRTTDAPPIFIGPVFLHGHSTEKAYQPFFDALARELKDCDKLVLGSDDETALRNEMKNAFPNSKQIVCMRHLMQNIIHRLQDKVGLEKKTTKHPD